MSKFSNLSLTNKFLIAGSIYGSFFPLMALVIRYFQFKDNHFLINTFSDPLVWIIFCAPFVLGFTAYLIAKKLTHIFNEQSQKTNEIVTELLASAGKLDSSSNELLEGSQKTATTINQISDQNESIKGQINNLMVISSDFEQLIADLSSKFKTILEVSDKTKTTISRSKEESTNLLSSTNNINETIGLIDAILLEVKILSFNAALEAERAGEEGRGFYVVAGEIQKLADRIQSFISAIIQLTNEISNSTGKLTTHFDSINTISDELIASTSNADTAVNTKKELTLKIQNIIEQSISKVDEISKAMNEVYLTAEENDNNAHDVRESSCSLKELSSNLSALSSK